MPLNFCVDPPFGIDDCLADLTDVERDAFAQFETEWKVVYENDEKLDKKQSFEAPNEFTKLRFLQSDGYNVKLATQRLMKTLIWRQKNNIDDLLKNPPDALSLCKRYHPRDWTSCPQDLKGHPVCLERTGVYLGSENHNCMSPKDMALCWAYELELLSVECQKRCREQKRLISKFTYVGNMTDAGYMNCIRKIPHFQMESNFCDPNYPEVHYRAVMINCPSIGPALWNICKNYLDPNTAAKISLQTDADISSLIDPALLPVDFGGTNKDAVVPPTPLFKAGAANHNETKVYVKTRHEVKLDVPEGATAVWRWRVQAYDLGFRVELADAKSPDTRVVLQPQEGLSSEGKGSYQANEGPKTVYLCFDNSHSRFRNKNLFHTCEIINADNVTA